MTWYPAPGLVQEIEWPWEQNGAPPVKIGDPLTDRQGILDILGEDYEPLELLGTLGPQYSRLVRAPQEDGPDKYCLIWDAAMRGRP